MDDAWVSLVVVAAGVVAFVAQQWVRDVYERKEQRHQLELEYLIDAFYAISQATNRMGEPHPDGTVDFRLERLTDTQAEGLETAVTAAGLHGSLAVVKEADRFTRSDSWDTLALQVAIRDDVRRILDREPVPRDIEVPLIHATGTRDAEIGSDRGEQPTDNDVTPDAAEGIARP